MEAFWRSVQRHHSRVTLEGLAHPVRKGVREQGDAAERVAVEEHTGALRVGDAVLARQHLLRHGVICAILHVGVQTCVEAGHCRRSFIRRIRTFVLVIGAASPRLAIMKARIYLRAVRLKRREQRDGRRSEGHWVYYSAVLLDG